MKRILVATDGSEGADYAVDYAARWARDQAADLLIVNIIGGLPDRLLRSFTHAQHAWLDELLESLSAETLTKARDRARGFGVATIQLESRSGEVAATIIDIAQATPGPASSPSSASRTEMTPLNGLASTV